MKTYKVQITEDAKEDIKENEDTAQVFAVFYAKSNWQNNLKLR